MTSRFKMADFVDEFERFKAMAFNFRRNSQSLPCSPQIPARPLISVAQSQHRHTVSTHFDDADDDDVTGDAFSSNIDASEKFSRLSMTEVWVNRTRMQRRLPRGSSSSEASHGDECQIQNPASEPNADGCSHSPAAPPRYLASAKWSNDVMSDVYRPSKWSVAESASGFNKTKHDVNTAHHSEASHATDSTSPRGMTSLGVRLHDDHAHKRSLSCRDRQRRVKNSTSASDAHDDIRPRTASMPLRGNRIRRPNTLAVTHDHVEVYLVRTFSTSKRGLINRGDSFKRRKTPVNGDSDVGRCLSNASSAASVASAASLPPVFHIQVVGARGVGKSSLLQQFTSSDYIANLHLDSNNDPGTATA